MAVKLGIFVSHSMGENDKGILDDLEKRLGPGVELFVAEWNPSPGQPLKRKIQRALLKSDLVLAILSKDGARSEWVNQEIGFAIGNGKTVIPMRERGVSPKAFIGDLEWITFDRENPEEALRVTTDYLEKLHSEKVTMDYMEKVQSRRVKRAAARESFAWGVVVLAVVGVVVGIVLGLALSGSKRSAR